VCLVDKKDAPGSDCGTTLSGFLGYELSINWTGPAHGEKFCPLDVVDLPPHQVDHRKVDLLYLTAMPFLHRILATYQRISARKYLSQ